MSSKWQPILEEMEQDYMTFGAWKHLFRVVTTVSQFLDDEDMITDSRIGGNSICGMYCIRLPAELVMKPWCVDLAG